MKNRIMLGGGTTPSRAYTARVISIAEHQATSPTSSSGRSGMPHTRPRQRSLLEVILGGAGRCRMPEQARASFIRADARVRSSWAALTRVALEVAST